MSATTVVLPTPPLFDEVRLALAGFLARYSGRPGSATAATRASCWRRDFLIT
jgi:hypothetical protein